MSSRRSRLAALIAAAATLAAFVGPVGAADEAMVRVVHASPDAPAIDVYVDGAKVGAPFAGLEFGDIDPGAYDLKVCADADNAVCPLDPGSLALAGGTSYSVFAIGSLTAETPSLTAVVAVDAVAAPATDTVGSSGSTWAAVALVLAGLALLAGAVRLTTRRVAA